MLIKRAQICGCLISHPEPVAHSTTNSLSVTLRDFSTTRVTARDGPEEKPHESIVKFPERKQELSVQEVCNLRIDLHEMDVNPHFWLAFPKDPAHKHIHEIDWDQAFCDSVIPQNLPPSGRFGHDSEISYSVEAYMLDLNSGKEIKASMPI